MGIRARDDYPVNLSDLIRTVRSDVVVDVLRERRARCQGKKKT